MFLNKIDLPYCLVVFFVVCPRLRPLVFLLAVDTKIETPANNKECNKATR